MTREPGTLRAAFAEVDVTPAPGLPLCGMPYVQVATGVHWPLHGRIALLDDGERRVAIAVLDASALKPSTAAAWRAALAAAGGLAADDVLLSCTHTHRAPCTIPDVEAARDDDYLDFALERLVGATAAAAVRLKPAQLRVGSVAAPGWSFNRRPIYRGGEVATHGPEWIEEFERLEGSADDELQVVLAVREADGTPLGGLVGFARHTTVVATDPVYSADFAGPLTEALAARHGCVFAFLQGAAGDVSPHDMTAPGRAQDGFAHAERMGRALAEAADAAIEGARPVALPRLRSTSELLTIEQRRPSAEQVRLARWYLEEREGEIDERDFTRRIYGHRYTFWVDLPEIQPWFARDTIALWEWQRLGGQHVPADRVEVQAIAVGDLAFATYPAEMFNAFGVRTKAESPFATTVVCSLANGWHSYVPTREAFAHGGYEPRLAVTSRLAEDAGDRMTDAALRLLAALHEPTTSLTAKDPA